MTDDDVTNVISSIIGSIYVKTIFIKGNQDVANGVTKGLNTQIPINDEDFIAASETTDKINKVLAPKSIKILRTGESTGKEIGLSPLAFVKQMLIIDGRPGESKNFNKSKIEEELKGILEKIQAIPNLVLGLKRCIEIDQWWNQYRKRQPEQSIVLRYGKNYFQSFVLKIIYAKNEEINELSSDDLEIYFEYFNNFFNSVENKTINLNEFKKDAKFSELVESVSNEAEFLFNPQHIMANYPVIDYENSNLLEYINNNRTNNYSVAQLITRFNIKHNVQIGKFRTISRISEKTKEHFPLSNSTFNELYLNLDYDKQTYKAFDDSLLKKMLEEEFSLYVLNLSDDKKDVESIDFIKSFNLSRDEEWEEKAKCIYEETVKAFEKGDESYFPKTKSSDGSQQYFHVRPKAKNARDTFEFTDGSHITKRTFWANKEYIDKLIDVYKKDQAN